MKEVVVVNNSETPIQIPLYEKVPVTQPVVKTNEKVWLYPGEELNLGVDVPTDRIRHFEQFDAIDINLDYREVTGNLPESEDVSGVRASGGKGAKIIKYADRNYVSIKFNKATIKIATNPMGVAAYWIGIAVVAPEGAASLVRAIEHSQNDLDKLKEPVLAADFDKKAVDGKDGWFFYTDLGLDVPRQWVRTRWLDADGAVIEETDYYMDFSELTIEKV